MKTWYGVQCLGVTSVKSVQVQNSVNLVMIIGLATVHAVLKIATRLVIHSNKFERFTMHP